MRRLPRHRQLRARDSVNPGSRCQGSERSDAASEQDSGRELNACHHNATASVFAEIWSDPFVLSLRLIR